MLPQEIIRQKRDGHALAAGDIEAFVLGLTTGSVTGEQAAAFAMAVYIRGMTAAETVALTAAMTASGRTLDWTAQNLPGPVLDKHSTGGIGDNVSLILAPLVAACGAFVPMISGRGLGHSGGTLDKLDAIPGYRTAPDLPQFRAVVRDAGCAIIDQTADLAPADKLLYAIRDVTATVESIPLITASILSKKRAAGLQGLVMDVKTGSGAFMATLTDARDLAQSIVEVAGGAGLPASALVTDMNESLASAAGNALEVRNAVDFLAGRARDPRLKTVVMALAAAMLVTGGLATSRAEAERSAETALANGSAAEHFARMVAALGGPHDLLEKPETRLLDAPVWREVSAARAGFVTAVNARAVGLAVVALGGGRTRPGDGIDTRVGFSRLAPIGAATAEQPLGIVHAATDGQAEAAADALRYAYRIDDTPPSGRPVVIETITARSP